MTESQSPLGKTFSHCRVIAKLGGGGMDVVYEAEDVKPPSPSCIRKASNH